MAVNKQYPRKLTTTIYGDLQQSDSRSAYRQSEAKLDYALTLRRDIELYPELVKELRTIGIPKKRLNSIIRGRETPSSSEKEAIGRCIKSAKRKASSGGANRKAERK